MMAIILFNLANVGTAMVTWGVLVEDDSPKNMFLPVIWYGAALVAHTVL